MDGTSKYAAERHDIGFVPLGRHRLALSPPGCGQGPLPPVSDFLVRASVAGGTERDTTHLPARLPDRENAIRVGGLDVWRNSGPPGRTKSQQSARAGGLPGPPRPPGGASSGRRPATTPQSPHHAITSKEQL